MTALDEVVRPGSAFSADELVLTSDDPDRSVRWTPGERLHHLFEQRCDALAAEGDPGRLAAGRDDLAVSYAELDARANRLARYLVHRGVRPGDRVGLVVDEAVASYVAMLAVGKCLAAYVPLDAGFPADRIAFICADAGVTTVLTVAALRDQVPGDVDAVCLDEVADLVAERDPARLTPAETGPAVDELCYVIYTSGTTGRPKGVAIEQAAICNFVRVAAQTYGVRPDDRMYQGMTIAFDFSVEEIWVAFAVGATLVPRPGAALLGDDLADFLREERVTALCCVPTLLATMADDLPDLRFLLVSGEACPQDLVARWYRPERRFLNVYGPTEATVTATWTTLAPDRPVTIGVPLPTYSVVVLDEDTQRPLPPGRVGEIAITGIGLARGYLGRADLTARAFLTDVPGLPPGRVYRTGDLGRVTADGQVECLGRIDTQVKIRGYRIELTEIESLLLALPGIGQAVVDVHEPVPGATELVAYYTTRLPGSTVDVDAIHAALSGRLPRYMVPAYFEQLTRIPMLPSDKADRKSLPPPTRPRRGAASGEHVEPADAREDALAAAVAELLGLPRVSATAHLFDELGLSSLLLAQLCARLRDSPELPPVTMRHLYRHPTVRELAAALPEARPRPSDPAPRAVRTASTAAYVACGAAQAACYLLLAALVGAVAVTAYRWTAAATDLSSGYLRAVEVSGALVAVLTLLPVAAKWILVGRFRPETFPLWGARYLRFWVVRRLVRASPVALLAGSPLYTMYLRALGARIGRGAVVLSRTVPVCTDLLTIGEHAVVRKDAVFLGFRAESGWIRTGRVDIGARAVVGEATCLDVDSSLGDGAQLGHSSSLHAGQHVPAGRRFHGSPAQETAVDYRLVRGRTCGGARRVGYALFQLAVLILVSGPLATAVLLLGLPAAYRLLTGPGMVSTDPTTVGFHLGWLAVASGLVVALVVVRLALVVAAARLPGRFLRPGRTYRLYGLHWLAHRAVGRLSNSILFNDLLGDSAFIVAFFRMIGYDLRPVLQTGSNFGLAVRHAAPGHVRIGTGTLISDGLSVVNADYSSSSFALTRAAIGARSFLGNDIAYPGQSVVGDDCLLATKVMVPIDGPVRSGVGLLGSPPFEIPRSTEGRATVEALCAAPDFPDRLARKSRSNLLTMGAFLLQRCLLAYGTAVILLVALALSDRVGVAAFGVAVLALLAFGTGFSLFVERASMGFRRLQPRQCSIYDSYYWRHERLWKLSRISFLSLFDGTPFKSPLWRLAGARVGRKVFDDGAVIPEKSLVTIGDGATLNVGAVIQCHSLEDGGFVSDHTVVGAGCTLGPRSFVHYGVRMGERTVLEPDAFLMKGTRTAADSRWGGNPAQEVDEPEPPRAPVRPARRSAGFAAVAAGLLVAVQAVLNAWGRAAGVTEARLVDAAAAAARGQVPVAVGLDQLAARWQLSGYGALTGAFDRHALVLTGARELALAACAAILLAVPVLARSLGVRRWAVVVALFGLAVCPPAIAALSTAGPGLLGAAWVTVGAALLVQDRAWLLVLGIVAGVVGVVTAPVLAVPVLIVAATFPVAVRMRRGALPLAVALVGTVLPLALLPAPGGPAAVPALVVVAVVVAAVLADGLGTRLARRR